MATKYTKHTGSAFPVVGIGGSAGAIEAVLEIAGHLTTHTGMAYIYIQHLNPEHDSKLVELLAKRAKIPVLQAEDGMALEADFFYVVPPGKELMVVDGSLKLEPRPETYDYMPINRSLISLADHYKEYAVGVILSGADSDGVEGVKAIKVAGGITFAQDESALFQSMPRSAVEEGAIDLVLPPREIAVELNTLAQQKEAYYTAIQEMNSETTGRKDEALKDVLKLVHKATRVDFGQYKVSTIQRRIVRRMALHNLDTLRDYVRYLSDTPPEIQHLFQDLLINVTAFFRDPDVVEYLKTTLLPDIIRTKRNSDAIRIWVPACSTGQEVYSLAILLIDVLGEKYTSLPIQIFATDLSEATINKARLGVYSLADVQDVPARWLQRFFVKTDGNYRIIKSIRDICVFATHNIAKDPPFSRVDIISCCNLLIYLDTHLQKKVLSTFHYALHDQGYLILGKSETVGSSGNLFTQVNKKIKVFAKKRDANGKALFDMTYHLPNGNKAVAAGKHLSPQKEQNTEADLEKAVDNILLKHFTPASVVIDRDMDIVLFRGATGVFLEPTPGKASLNLLKMARPGLGFELRNAVHRAQKTSQVVKKTSVDMTHNGKTHHIDIEVIPVKTDLEESYYLVTFKEAEPHPLQVETGSIKDRRVKQLEAELAGLRDDIRTIVDAQEAANEELQSANEEIVSSNEELQSINEELETSKEEVESSNEELITINQELQLRNEQLTETQEYAESVFRSIHESLLILDKNLRVKTANFAFYKTFNLREEHTEGRLLYDLNHKQWDIPKLRKLLEDLLLATDYITGFEISHHFNGIGEKKLVLNARRVTQKISSDQIVLLAIEDITEHRRAQQIISDREIWFRNLADNAPVMIWVTERDKRASFFNKAWLEFRNDTLAEALQKGWTDGVHPDDLEKTLKLFDECFAEKLPFELRYRVLYHDEEYVWLHNKAKPNFTPEGQFIGFIGSCVVISEVLEEKKG